MKNEEIIQIIKNKPVYTTDYLIRTQRAIEAYNIRLLLIALRILGVNYKQARSISTSKFLTLDTLFKMPLDKIDTNKSDIIMKTESLSNGIKLFREYSSVLRNKIEHGAYGEIHDIEALKLATEINQSILREIEALIVLNFGVSAFAEPKLWGAKKSNKVFDEDEIKKMKIGRNAKALGNKNDIRTEFEKINWHHKNQ